MKLKLIALLGVIIVILVSTTVYFTTTNKVNQPIVQKVAQQSAPASAPTTMQESNQVFKAPGTETKIIAVNNKTGECQEFQSTDTIPSEWIENKEFKNCEEVEIRRLNTQRISAISTIRIALEIYYADNQKYPQDISLLLTKYLSKNESIVDPKTKEDYFYTQLNNGKNYHLGVKLDEEDIIAVNALKTDADFYSTGFNGFDGKDPIYDRTSLR